MGRGRKPGGDDDRGESVVTSVANVTRLPEAIAEQDPSLRPAKLMAQPDKGRSFPEALEESMRDHRNVYAALAK